RGGPGGDLRPGGCGSAEGHHRPQRRQRRSRLPARPHGARQHHRDGPLRPRALPADREARRGHRPPLRRGLRPPHGALPRRQLLERHALRGRQAPDAPALALQSHSRRHPACPPKGRGQRRPDRPDAAAQSPRDLRGPAAGERIGTPAGKRMIPVVLGSGAYRYEVHEAWAKLPSGREFNADVAAVGVDAQDRVYAFNRGRHPMVVFDRDGNFLRSWGEGVFHRAHGVHVAPDDTLWLTDDGDHPVRHCTLDGKVLLTLGVPGKPTAYMSGEPFHRCTHTALSPRGDLYVSDGYGNSRVHKYSPNGTLLLSWGEPGTDPGQFNIPHNVCCDADGWVYVADRENHRVQMFDGNGRFETQWNNMHRPSGLYMEGGAQGRFYVGEIGGGMGVNYDMPNTGPG